MQDMQANSTIVGSAPNGGGAKKNSKLWLAIIALAVVVVGGIAWAAVTFYNQNQAADIATLQEDGPAVTIAASGFNPSTIKIKVGQEVTWTSESDGQHQLQADIEALPGFDSGEALATGDSYTYTFDKAGTFTYFDANNPEVYKGTVIVE